MKSLQFIWIMIFVLLFVIELEAKVIMVYDGSPQPTSPYPRYTPRPGDEYDEFRYAAHTITAALQVAEDGDFVVVRPASKAPAFAYVENLTIKKSITLISEFRFFYWFYSFYERWPKIYAAGPGSVITARNLDFLRIEGFESANGAAEKGGGIFAENIKKALIIRCNIIKNNKADKDGGGVHAYNVTGLVLQDNEIGYSGTEYNEAGEYGGGTDIRFCKFYIIYRNSIKHNRSARYGGGGVNLEASGSAPRDWFFNNDVSRNNGAWKKIEVEDSDRELARPSGGGIRVKNARITIKDSIFDNNIAFLDGGGILGYWSTVYIIGKTDITGNRARDDDGGGISVTVNTLLEAIGETDGELKLLGNIAQVNGGGIHCTFGSEARIKNVRIERKNSATTGDGGGIYSRATVELERGNVIKENECANLGGGICVITESYPEVGVLTTKGYNLIEGNKSGGDGGAIALIRLPRSPILPLRFKLKEALIMNNESKKSDNYGADGVYISTIYGYAAKDNRIEFCSFVNHKRSAIKSVHSERIENQYQIFNNVITFTTEGAGISLENDSPVIDSNKIRSNYIGIRLTNSSPLITNNTFSDNVFLMIKDPGSNPQIPMSNQPKEIDPVTETK